MQINTAISKVNFKIKKMLFLTVKGEIPEVKGSIDLNENKLSDSKIDLQIAINGIDTKNAKRDEHLMQEDFFHAEKYPEMTFQSTEIAKKSGEHLLASGDLTICGVTKRVEIPFQINATKVTGEFSLNRKDYNFGKIPTFVVGNQVNITFDCSLH